MPKNINRKVFKPDGNTSATFTVPAGVQKIRAVYSADLTPTSFFSNRNVTVDLWGNLWTWGLNNNGQIGDGTTVNKLSPTRITNGIRKAFLRADGQMFNFGGNTYGQIGDGTTVPKSTPTLVSGGYRFDKVVRSSTCFGLTTSGDLYGWGRNDKGQLGQGDTVDRSTPTLIASGTKFVDFWTDGINDVNLTAPNSIWAKDTAGQLWAWGFDRMGLGALGTGSVGSVSTPTLVTASLNIVKVSHCSATNAGHTVALTSDGDIYAWGANSSGQLGDNTIIPKSTPTLVIGGLKFRDVMAGRNSSLGITRTSGLYLWGDNTYGQLGQGNIFPKSSPTTVTGIGITAQVHKAYINIDSVFCINQERQMTAWGYQETLYPVLGTGDNVPKSIPTLVSGIGQASLVEDVVSCDGAMTHVITKYGSRFAWGDNAGGNLGCNSATARFNTPQQVTNVYPGFQTPTAYMANWTNIPYKQSMIFDLSVNPGATLNIIYGRHGIFISEFDLPGGVFSDSLTLEWEG